MSKQVFPQAPSPTITNLRLISAIAAVEVGKLWLARARNNEARSEVAGGR